MSEIELFKTWAAAESIWSVWAKPVLFANAPASFSTLPTEWPDVELPEPSDMAIVCELAGDDAVSFGIAAARKGYRPVPLFNCAPGAVPAIPWEGIVHRLREGAGELMRLQLPVNAPPIFLLDSQRMKPTRPVTPGTFDNRWVVFAQDFPSAGFLKAHGIRTVMLLQEEAMFGPQEDLAHVLLRWQEGGLALITAEAADGMKTWPLTVRKPSNFRALFYRVMVALGLRRNSAGGFGAVVPQPSSGG
jgi:hypothetical protein